MGPNSLRALLRPKNLARAALKLAPRTLRHEAYRRLISLSYDIPPDTTFELARSREDLERAFKLLHDQYVTTGLMKPHSSGMRITPYHALPSTSTVVCKRDGRVLATISIIRESALGFPINSIFDTSRLKKDGARLAEYSSLAVDPEARGAGRVLFPLFTYAFRYGLLYFGVDYMVIAVHPNHFEFYESILFFSQLERRVVEHYDFANGAPAVGGYRRTKDLPDDLLIHYGRNKPEQNLFRLFIEHESDCFKFPDRRFHTIADPVMTPDLLRYFFIEKTDVFQQLTNRERSILSAIYSHPKYEGIVPSPTDSKHEGAKALAPCFDVQLEGKIETPELQTIRMVVTEVSRAGFRAYLSDRLTSSGVVRANIEIGELEIAELGVSPLSSGEDRLYDFRIEDESPSWGSFVGKLFKDVVQEVDPASQPKRNHLAH